MAATKSRTLVRRRAALCGVLLLTGIVPATASALTLPTPGLEGPACVRAEVADAAPELYGPGTTVVRTQRVAGLKTALVSEPYIAPGTRHRMVFDGVRWCDAEAGMNRAWIASGRRAGDGRGLAAAYARLAAAPYFDGVRILSHSESAGVHRIVTHARTNGVVARWTIVTDAVGVRTARWRSERLGVRPFTAQIEGLTALPGGSERYVRSAAGLLGAIRGLPQRFPDPEDLHPAPEASFTTSDGFKVMVSVGESRAAVDTDVDAGSEHVDFIRLMRDVVKENMEEFLRWGLRSEWSPSRVSAGIVRLPATGAVPVIAPDKTGWLFVNDSTSGYCQACVFIGDDFNIHMLSEFSPVLTALGYTYPAGKEREVISDVLGHETFHNFQNSYVKPDSTGKGVAGFYSEGTARFQETLHSYSEISHQAQSLVYANDANGCNGLHGDDPSTTMAAGPFVGAYEACNFWLPFYGTYGLEAFVRLINAGAPQGATEFKAAGNDAAKILRAVELATGRSMHEAAAVWARGVITGKNMTWAGPLGGVPALDWGKFLERWAPDVLNVGASATATLGGGGVMAYEVAGAVRPTVAGRPAASADPKSPPAGAPAIAVLRDGPGGATLTYPAAGDYVPGPAAGEKLYVMATRANQGDQDVTLTLNPGGTPPAPAAAPVVTSGSMRVAAAPRASCRRSGSREVVCRLTGFGGTSVVARASRDRRILAEGSAALRRGRGVLRLRASRRLRAGKITVSVWARGAGASKRVTVALRVR